MSDVFEGPGWWMASDGKWYPPHLHADASYRARWVNVGAAVARPDTSQNVLTVEPAPVATETRTAINEPVRDPRANGRPVADVPPQNGAGFVASDRVAERAAALADTARAEQAVEAVAPVVPPSPVAGNGAEPAPASPPEPIVSEAAPAPTPELAPPVPTVAAPEPSPVTPDEQPTASMPQPVVETHDAPAPLRPTVAPAGPAGFGAPTSTPVSEILNRLTDEDFGRLTPPEADDEDDTTAAAAPVEDPSTPPVEAVTPPPVVEVPEERLVSVAPPEDTPRTEVRVGPTVVDDPPLEPIEFEAAETAEIDTAAASSRARLEVGTPTERGEERFGLLTPNRPTEQRIQLQEQPPMSASTDLVPVTVTEIAVYSDGPTIHDRLVASVLFLSGVALIVGTFLVWTTAPGTETTGWDMNDGIATVVAGVLGSAAAGPIFVGFRNIIPKSIAIVSGLVGIVVPGLHGLEALSDSDLAETGVGAGFWVVLGGAVAMLLAGVADQSRFGD